MPSLKKVDLEDSDLFLIDYQILKTAGLAGLAGLVGLPSPLLQQAEGLAEFIEIIAFICETLKVGRICLVLAMMNLKPAVFENFVFDWEMCLIW